MQDNLPNKYYFYQKLINCHSNKCDIQGKSIPQSNGLV